MKCQTVEKSKFVGLFSWAVVLKFSSFWYCWESVCCCLALCCFWPVLPRCWCLGAGLGGGVCSLKFPPVLLLLLQSWRLSVPLGVLPRWVVNRRRRGVEDLKRALVIWKQTKKGNTGMEGRRKESAREGLCSVLEVWRRGCRGTAAEVGVREEENKGMCLLDQEKRERSWYYMQCSCFVYVVGVI